VDFAPHDLEFLREAQAHERLGFPPAQIEQWLGESGLKILSVDQLAPEAGEPEGTLTVMLWTAERVRVHAHSRQTERLTKAEVVG
jgi:ArsR family transcriptional regulator